VELLFCKPADDIGARTHNRRVTLTAFKAKEFLYSLTPKGIERLCSLMIHALYKQPICTWYNLHGPLFDRFFPTPTRALALGSRFDVAMLS
jgi:hypothetical protein